VLGVLQQNILVFDIQISCLLPKREYYRKKLFAWNSGAPSVLSLLVYLVNILSLSPCTRVGPLYSAHPARPIATPLLLVRCVPPTSLARGQGSTVISRLPATPATAISDVRRPVAVSLHGRRCSAGPTDLTLIARDCPWVRCYKPLLRPVTYTTQVTRRAVQSALFLLVTRSIGPAPCRLILPPRAAPARLSSGIPTSRPPQPSHVIAESISTEY